MASTTAAPKPATATDPSRFTYENDKLAIWLSTDEFSKDPTKLYRLDGSDLVRPHHIAYAVQMEAGYDVIQTLVQALRPAYHNHPMLHAAEEISRNRGDDTELIILSNVCY